MNPFGPPFEKLGGETAGYCPTFTGDSTDWVGSNDGTISGGVTIVRDREKGGLQCWEGDGTGSVALDTQIDLDASTQPWSVAFWAKRSNTNTKGMVLGSSGTSSYIWLFSSTFRIKAASGTETSATVASITDWNHYVITHDGTTLRMYVNGVEEATNISTAGRDLSISQLLNGYPGTTYAFAGKLDDVRITDGTCLSPTEIKELYKRGYQRRYAAEHLNPVLAVHPSEDKFGAVSGSTVAHDLSGNAATVSMQAGVAYTNNSERGGRKAFSHTSGGTAYITTDYVPTADGPFSATAFFKASAGAGAYYTIFSVENGGTRNYLQVRLENGLIQASFTGGIVTGAVDLRGDDTWHAVAFTYNGSVGELFLDGVSVGSAPLTQWSVNLGPFYVGSTARSASINNFNGLIDAAQVFDYALSESEIRLLAQSRTAKYIEPEDELVAWYCPTQTPGDVAAGSGPINLLLDGNNGTLNGTATYDTADTDKSGSAALDLASGDYVDLASELSYSGDFTVSFWKQGNISSKLVGSSSAAKSIEQTASTTIRVGFGTNADFTVPANDANWHFVTVTRRDGTLRLYYDGTESSTGGVSNSDTVLVGRVGGDSTTQNYVGLVDNVKIYNRALYPREIAKQYAMERPGVPLSYNGLFGDGLNNELPTILLNTPIEAGSGTAIEDKSTNKNDGTLTGAWTTGPNSFSVNAVDLNGGSDGIVLSSAMDIGDSVPFTVLSRFRWHATTGGRIIGDNSSFGQRIRQGSDTQIQVTDSAGGSSNFTVPSMGTIWHDLAVTRSASNGLRAYVDCVESSTGELNNVNTDGTFNFDCLGKSGASGGGDNDLDETMVLQDELNLLQIGAFCDGPAPIFTGSTLPTISPQESTECTVSYPTNAFGLDPRWGAGTNGTVTEWLYWYLADDANGTNETLVAVTQDPAGYTPQVGEAGKYLRVGIEPENSGGYDPAEFWYSDYALIASASGGTPSGSGAVSAVGSLTGAGQTSRTGEGDVTAIGSLTGAGLAANGGSGSIAAVASLSAAGQHLANGQGVVDAIGSLTGAGSAAMSGAGSVTAIASLTGAGTAPVVGGATGAGTITAIGTLIGSGSTTNSGAGSVDAIGSLTGAGTAPALAPAAGAGSVTAIGSLIGAGQTSRTGEGDVTAIGSLTGAATAPNGGSGSIAAVASLTGAGQQNVKPLLIYYYDAFLATST